MGRRSLRRFFIWLWKKHELHRALAPETVFRPACSLRRRRATSAAWPPSPWLASVAVPLVRVERRPTPQFVEEVQQEDHAGGSWGLSADISATIRPSGAGS